MDGDWNRAPHRARIVRVTAETLMEWKKFTGEVDGPPEHAPLLTPVSVAELPAISALAAYPRRLVELAPQISSGFHESGAKKSGLIEYGLSYPESWSEVVLKGLQLGVATPFFKEPDAGSDLPINLGALTENAVPRSEYRAVQANRDRFEVVKDRWVDSALLAHLRSEDKVLGEARVNCSRVARSDYGEVTTGQIDKCLESWASRPYTAFYRVAWRMMIASDTERSLYVSLIPPGAAHIHGVLSAVLENSVKTVLLSGFWASLPLDYFLRTAAVAYLQEGAAKRMPAPSLENPLATPLVVRALRLNCLTSAYANLWVELFDPVWAGEVWAVDWPGLEKLEDVSPEWTVRSALRSERARRAASVEMDALVAVWLGIDADTLITMYRARFPILQDFERVMWFDARGRKIAGDRYTYGWGQSKEHWTQFEKYQADPENNPVPDGYTAPFYKADREREMREAHAVFQARLDAAIADGKWDPVKQEVPSS